LRGESTTEMKIPVIRMCDGDMYPSYEGWYGVGGDVHATGGPEHQSGHEKRQGHIMGRRNVGVVVCGVAV